MAEGKRNKVVILGAGGRLGAALAREYRRDFQVVGYNHGDLDLGATEKLRSTLESLDFDVLINAAAQTKVDHCEADKEDAFKLNAEAPRVIAAVCRMKNARFVHISTDYVFDGEKREPYTEKDEARPISIYGESKLEGERLVFETYEQALVVRVSWVFGPDRPSFIDAMIQTARQKEEVTAVSDKYSTPTYTLDICNLLRPLLLERPERGVLHIANSGECSWQEYAQWAIDCCDNKGILLKAKKVEATSLAEMKNFIAKRPVYSVLSPAKYQRVTGEVPRHWRHAVAEYVRDHVR
ncbi:MAG TPA: dTDP-4-dehydrorhamnose reductase [Chthoniobacterales bacterium]|nr:dTDP-4-dehydrorhamnose reductase [Chthoniobacterales bacterium]